MFDTYHPKRIIGFHDDIEHSKGTRNMLTIGLKNGVSTSLITSEGKVFNSTDLTKLLRIR